MTTEHTAFVQNLTINGIEHVIDGVPVGPDHWDYEGAVLLQPVPRKKRRVVYSLSLNPDEFEALSQRAEARQMKLGTYIKWAALRSGE